MRTIGEARFAVYSKCWQFDAPGTIRMSAPQILPMHWGNAQGSHVSALRSERASPETSLPAAASATAIEPPI